jgi:hypothetical protein
MRYGNNVTGSRHLKWGVQALLRNGCALLGAEAIINMSQDIVADREIDKYPLRRCLTGERTRLGMAEENVR